MYRSRSAVLSGGLIALTALVSLALYPRLPADVAIHFSASGTPDNYVANPVGVALLPVVMVLTFVFMQWVVRYDPPTDPQVPAVVTVATMGFLGTLHVLVLGWNLGYPVPFDLVVVGSLVWAAGLCGYAVRREGVSFG
jgi:uncharacterized membrane protein